MTSKTEETDFEGIGFRLSAVGNPRASLTGTLDSRRAQGQGHDLNAQNCDLESSTSSVRLQRTIGVFGGIAMVAGNMIGSGIFISPTGVLIGAGSVGMSLITWALCGVAAILGGLCFAELGTMIPESGAEYVYIMRGLGPLLAFVCAWVSNLIINPAQIAIMSTTCAHYIVAMFGCGGAGSTAYINFLTAIILLLLCAINCYKVSLVNKLAVVFTSIKMLALICIMCGGLVKISQGHTQYLVDSFEGSHFSPGMLAIGLYNGLWAYDGWKQLNLVTEELQEPKRNLPRCIIYGISLVTLLYVATNISYFSVMSPQELLTSHAVALTWAGAVMPSATLVIMGVVVISTFACALGTMFTVSRLNFVAARHGHTASILSMVNIHQRTPVPTVIFSTLMALLTSVSFDLNGLIEYFSFTSWLFYGLSFAVVLVMRRTHKDIERPYKVATWIPVVMLIISVFLVLTPIIQNPRAEFLIPVGLMVSGALVYYPFIVKKYRLRYMDYITLFLQKLFCVVPSTAEF